MTKPAIFLVEEIIDGHPVSLYEKITWNLCKKIRSEGKTTFWLPEVPRLLNSYNTSIKFVAVRDFIAEVSLSGMPKDYDVYYFIACRHYLDLTNIEDFLLIDYNVLDFLAEKNIPIILDSSCEQVNHYQSTKELVEKKKWLYDRAEFEILKKIKFIVVGSTNIPKDYSMGQTKSLDVRFSFFPSGFFFYNYEGSDFNLMLKRSRNNVIERIQNKKITDETFVWEAWQNEPRWYRTLFQLKAEYRNLVGNFGKYSRLNKGKQRLLDFINNQTIHGTYPEIQQHPYFSFLTKGLLDSSDEIKILDSAVPWPHDTKGQCIPVLNETDVMFYVALETCEPKNYLQITNSTSNLTEKCTLRITSGQAFIPLGGQHLGTILTELGFKDFKKLEWPCIPHIFDEIDYVLDRIEDIASLSLVERQNLYEDWKENLIHNFNQYIDIDIPSAYLNSIRNAK